MLLWSLLFLVIFVIIVIIFLIFLGRLLLWSLLLLSILVFLVLLLLLGDLLLLFIVIFIIVILFLLCFLWLLLLLWSFLLLLLELQETDVGDGALTTVANGLEHDVGLTTRVVHGHLTDVVNRGLTLVLNIFDLDVSLTSLVDVHLRFLALASLLSEVQETDVDKRALSRVESFDHLNVRLALGVVHGHLTDVGFSHFTLGSEVFEDDISLTAHIVEEWLLLLSSELHKTDLSEGALASSNGLFDVDISFSSFVDHAELTNSGDGLLALIVKGVEGNDSASLSVVKHWGALLQVDQFGVKVHKTDGSVGVLTSNIGLAEFEVGFAVGVVHGHLADHEVGFLANV